MGLSLTLQEKLRTILVEELTSHYLYRVDGGDHSGEANEGRCERRESHIEKVDISDRS